MSYNDELRKTKRALDEVSDSFCLAKWLQVTVHLQFGGTHSCHHPDTHIIPLKELKKDPSALHNTNEKKLQRKMMLNGERPSGCSYCWKAEDMSSKTFSDRIIKSNDPWAKPGLGEITHLPWDKNVNPTYLEVSFSNACNLKCLYCYPHISSSWYNEIKRFGPYELSYPHNSIDILKAQGKRVIPREEENPYVEAFWKWFPEISDTLKVFRITGGEPLLSPSTFKVLDSFLDRPNPELELSVNTNLALNSTVIKTFGEKLSKLQDQNAVKKVRLYTSLDGWGRGAEYIRSGLDLTLFEENLNYLLSRVPHLDVTVMCTFNALSLFSYQEFLVKILEWKKVFKARGGNLYLDISFLTNPPFLDVHLIPQKFFPLFAECLKLMESHRAVKKAGFLLFEINKMKRVIEYYETKWNRHMFSQYRADLVRYVLEVDRRRGTSFEETFPEFKGYVGAWLNAEPERVMSPKRVFRT